MRLINIHQNDSELFDRDVCTDDYLFYQSHIPTFKRMWNDQGSTFWLRVLVSFREYMKHAHIQNIFNAKGELPMCIHEVLQCMDLCFIHIHKSFLEGDFSSAKALICDTFILAQNLHLLSQLESSSLVYDPFYSTSTRDSFRNLFGLPRDKYSNLKVVINYPLYMKFGGAVFKLLRKWLSEVDIPEKDTHYVNNKFKYWLSYEIWLKKDFCSGYFESHIAKYWNDKLPAMLLTTDIHNIFLHAKTSLCNCNNKKNGFFKEEVIDFCRIRSACHKHKDCCRKIIHSMRCEDPQFCRAENFACKLTCENELKRQKQSDENKAFRKSESQSSFWKRVEVYIESCADENHRNVGTLAESHDHVIESFYFPKETEVSSALRSVMEEMEEHSVSGCMPAEVINAVMQCKKIESIKNRLRGKLNKKNRMKIIKLLEDPLFRLKMVDEAERRFRKDLEIEAKECGCNNWKDHERDTCPNILGANLKSLNMTTKARSICNKGECLSAESERIMHSASLASVAVGTDERSAFGKVIQPRKKKQKKNKKSFNDINPEESKPGKESTIFLSKNVECPSNDSKAIVGTVSGDPEFNRNVSSEVLAVKLPHSGGALPVNANQDVKEVGNDFFQDSKDSDSSSKRLNEYCNSSDVLIVVESILLDETKEEFKEIKVFESLSKNETAGDPVMKIIPKCGVDTRASENSNGPSCIPDNSADNIKAVDTLLSVLKTGNFNIKEGDVNKDENIIEMNNGIKEEEVIIPVKPMKKFKLHVCVHCKRMETVVRTFKKCSRCKAENFPEPRYYCTRECQVEDWEESHREEHLRNGNAV